MWKRSRSSANLNNLSQGIVRLARCLFTGISSPAAAYLSSRNGQGKERTAHGTEDLSGHPAAGGRKLHREGRAPAGNRDPDLGLSAAGIQAGQMLCKTGGAAETAAARAADAGRLSALHRVLSGREWRRPMPDRTETALYKTVGSAGIFLHQLDGHGGRPDRISQLPGREPAPH